MAKTNKTTDYLLHTMDSIGKHYTHYFLLLLQERNAQGRQKNEVSNDFSL